MPKPGDLYRGTTGVMSVLLVLIGVALIVRTITAGGGALAFGLLMGVLFIAAGLGRMYINTRLARRAPREP